MQEFLEWVKPGSRAADLAARIDPTRLPGHIAVIMDGNGRWARQRLLPRVAGHRAGVDAVHEIIESCGRLSIEALTLYAFSIENWKRPPDEVSTLWRLLREYLRRQLPEIKAQNVRFQAIGRLEDLPQAVQEDLDEATVETAANTGLRLNVALNYSGRAEIVDAVNALLRRARQQPDLQVDEASFSESLSTSGLADPDLLIRTSGEVRVSNFLLWQIAYTEIWVTEKFWPEFRAADLLEAILDYQRRERRFGGLGRTADEREPALVGVRGGDDSPSLDRFSE